MTPGRAAFWCAIVITAVLTIAGAVAAVRTGGAMPYRYADPLEGAMEHLAQARPDAAARQLQLYVRYEPNDHRGWHLLGVALVLAGDMPGRADAIDGAGRIGPGAERALARGIRDAERSRITVPQGPVR